MPKTKTVYIIESDTEFPQSAKSLLESYDMSVRVCEISETFIADNNCREKDIILLELDAENPLGFKLLNQLLSAPKRPEIVIAASELYCIKPSDKFPGQRVTIFEHPIVSQDFLKAVKGPTPVICQ